MALEVTVLTINRVVVDKFGSAMSAPMAALHHSIVSEVAFIREDGWVLGAPKQFATVAFEMWANEWTHFAKGPNWDMKPIWEYYQ